MKYSYDLHIHSILSPCADELQTPNNILNMCMLKGLNIVAITDHNSLKQLPIFDELKSSYDILFLYGVEVSVLEGFHVLIYFESLDKALNFDCFIESYIDNIKPDFDQIICDIYDNMVTIYQRNLNCDIRLGYADLINKVRELDGIVILAHIDRTLNKKSNMLEMIEKLDFDAFELTKYCDIDLFFKNYPFFNKYKYLINSDAHTLMDINEATSYIELDELSFSCLFSYLRAKNE